MIEKQVWQSVNRCRYRAFQSAWKDFFRQWRREPNFRWPADVSFEDQRACLQAAAERYELPQSPLDDATRQAAVAEASRDAAEIFAASDNELDQIIPPIEALLP